MSSEPPSPRTIVVTGSSSGIGYTIAESFLKREDNVVLHGNRQFDALAKLAADFPASASLSLKADFRDPAAIAQFVEAAFDWHGFVDVWIHAAGADVLTVNTKLSFEEKLELLWQVDVRGTMLCCRQVADRLKQQPKRSAIPSILTIGWDQASSGMEGDSGQLFSATKSAVENFTRSLAKSVGPQVRVNGVAPGWIQTSWGQHAPEHWDRRARKESCLDRWGRPADVAQAALFLSSAEAEFINGQIVQVNGGWKPAWP